MQATNLRDTFGIIDKNTGKIYPDILIYFLEHQVITDIKILPNSVIYDKDNVCYLLQMDSKLRRALKEHGIMKVIISFQRRTTGNIALARIYKEKYNVYLE